MGAKQEWFVSLAEKKRLRGYSEEEVASYVSDLEVRYGAMTETEFLAAVLTGYGEALVALGESVGRDEPLGIGNVDWLEWLAATFRYALEVEAQSLEDAEVARAEALVEGPV